jgi:hypothetical protein
MYWRVVVAEEGSRRVAHEEARGFLVQILGGSPKKIGGRFD